MNASSIEPLGSAAEQACAPQSGEPAESVKPIEPRDRADEYLREFQRDNSGDPGLGLVIAQRTRTDQAAALSCSFSSALYGKVIVKQKRSNHATSR